MTMRMYLISTLFIFLFVSTLPVAAQDAEAPAGPVFVVSTHQCDWSQLDTVIQHHQERMMPLGQALVDEGTIGYMGAAAHLWGDDWNYITWVSAPDLQTLLTGYDQMNARYAEAHPDDTTAIAICPQHRDNVYQGEVSTQPGPAASEEMAAGEAASGGEPPVLAVSYYTCDYQALDTLIAWERDRNLPIAQELVDDGLLISQGVFTHLWGDEWNYSVTRSAKDLPTLLAANDLAGERYAEAYGEAPETMFGAHCTNHRDNIYTVTMETQ